MSARNRERRVRNAAGEKPKRIRWSDVDALLDLTPMDVDYIVDRPRFSGGEDDDGAPASVYSDPALLRQWLSVHEPLNVCDGPDCRKRHPDAPGDPRRYPGGRECDGNRAHGKAQSRARAGAVRELHEHDPRAPVTSVSVYEFLTSEATS